MRRASSLLSAAASATVGAASNASSVAVNASGWLAGKLSAGVGTLRGYVSKSRSDSGAAPPADSTNSTDSTNPSDHTTDPNYNPNNATLETSSPPEIPIHTNEPTSPPTTSTITITTAADSTDPFTEIDVVSAPDNSDSSQAEPQSPSITSTSSLQSQSQSQSPSPGKTSKSNKKK